MNAYSNLKSYMLLTQGDLLLHWNSWSPTELKDVIKSYYEKGGFAVDDTHGRLEPGCDLVARRYNFSNSRVLETVGIQVTKAKADKYRVKELSFAFLQKAVKLDAYVIYALKGKAEDFDAYLQSLRKFIEKVEVISGAQIEEMILTNRLTPDSEFGEIYREIIGGRLFKDLVAISDLICSKGSRTKHFSKKTIIRTVRHINQVNQDLRYFMRGLESLQKSSRTVFNLMMAALEQNDDLDFILCVKNGLSEVLNGLQKVSDALRRISKYETIMRLIWISLGYSERACFDPQSNTKRFPRRKSYEDFYHIGYQNFWFFFDYEPEGSSNKLRLMHMFYRMGEVAAQIKRIVERIFRFNIHDTESLENALRMDISHTPF